MFTSDPSASRLGGVHLDQAIGHFSPDASVAKVVAVIRQSPEMVHRLSSSRVLVIDDGTYVFAPCTNYECLTFVEQSI
jgi:hypothetical protein